MRGRISRFGQTVLIVVVLAMQSCGKGSSVVEPPNSPPTIPILHVLTGAPPDGSVAQMRSPVLSWRSTDADGDPISYDVYLGTDPNPSLYSSRRIRTCQVSTPLEYNTKYYWYVVAADNHGHQSVSPVWSFTTIVESLQCTATGAPLIGLPPLTVDFTGEVSKGLEPYQFFWIFGDDGTSESLSPVHVYTQPGTYTAVFKVSDAISGSCSKALSIFVKGPPACGAFASPSIGPSPLVVEFTAVASGGQPPYTYVWDFGDGILDSTADPRHVFVDSGLHIVALTVTDSELLSCSKNVTVAVGPLLTCTASLNPGLGKVPLTVYFYGRAAGGRPPYTYQWAFGDGFSSNAKSPSHTYNAVGPFTVVFTVTDVHSAICSKTFHVVVQDTGY